jgi:uncharacterized protein
MNPTALNPTSHQERIIVVDILRGFALLGVLAVNMLDFSSPVFMLGYVTPDWGVLDQFAEGVVFFLATGKFYLLFSFLFGLGFAIQMGRAEQSGRAFVPFYLRRLTILLVIGVLHGVLLWHGDILSTYALAGMVLLSLRRVRTSRLLALAGVLMIVSLFVFAAGDSLSEWNESDMTAAKMVQTIRDSSYGEMIRFRIESADQIVLMIVQIPSVFAMFLLGLIIGRGDLLANLDQYKPLLYRWGWIGLWTGLAGNFLFVWGLDDKNMALAGIGITSGAPALSLWYISLIVRFAGRLRALAPVGQMALTNYLSQTVICTTLFYGYGFGLYNEVNPAPRLLLILAIYGAQIVFSRWWLRRFRFGPVEWVWRSLTYGSWQPISRVPARASSG